MKVFLKTFGWPMAGFRETIFRTIQIVRNNEMKKEDND